MSRKWWEKDPSQDGGWWEELARPPEWVQDAVCPQADPEQFFPEKGESTREAKRLCEGCPVQADCLEYAVENGIRDGVWGGWADRERKDAEPEVLAAEVARLRAEQRARVVPINRVPARFQRNAHTRAVLAASPPSEQIRVAA